MSTINLIHLRGGLVTKLPTLMKLLTYIGPKQFAFKGRGDKIAASVRVSGGWVKLTCINRLLNLEKE